MRDAMGCPSHIYLLPGTGPDGEATWCDHAATDDAAEYIRADINHAELAQARNEALEEAAKVADQLGAEIDRAERHAEANGAFAACDAIRSLMTKEAGNG